MKSSHCLPLIIALHTLEISVASFLFQIVFTKFITINNLGTVNIPSTFHLQYLLRTSLSDKQTIHILLQWTYLTWTVSFIKLRYDFLYKKSIERIKATVFFFSWKSSCFTRFWRKSIDWLKRLCFLLFLPVLQILRLEGRKIRGQND